MCNVSSAFPRTALPPLLPLLSVWGEGGCKSNVSPADHRRLISLPRPGSAAWKCLGGGGWGAYVTIALRSGGNSVTFSDSCLVAGQKKLLFCITVNSQSEGGILGADAHRRPTANCSSFSGFLFANADGKTTGLASRSRETSRGFRATAESKLLLRSPLNEPKTLNASANVRTSERERKKTLAQIL